MKRIFQNHLDERQEEVMLKIEHVTCWVGFVGLFLCILTELSFLGRHPREMVGEFIVFSAMALTLMIGCISQGIWDRYLSLSPKTNVLAALVAGLLLTLVNLLAGYLRFHAFWSPVAYLLPFALTFLVTFALLSLCSYLTKKRQDKLEEETE